MKTIKAIVTFEFDEDIMCDLNDPESVSWFLEDVLNWQDAKTAPLILHSNEIGDEIGILKIEEIISGPY